MKIKVVHGAHGDKKHKSDYLSVAQTKAATVIFEEDPLFEQEVIDVRQRFGITPDWLIEQDKNPYHEALFNKNWDEEKRIKFLDECREITSRLFLPYYWWYSIYTYIAFGYFPTPETTSLQIISSRTSEGKFEHMTKHAATHVYESGFVIIAVPEKVSKQRLYELIDQQWDEISPRLEQMNDVPRISMKRINLTKSITEMRDMQKMTFPEISDQLSEDFAEDDEICDLVSSENYVRNLYHRWKNALKRKSMCPF